MGQPPTSGGYSQCLKLLYLRSGIDSLRDYSLMATLATKVVETMVVTWEAMLNVGALSPPLLETVEQGGGGRTH